MSDRSLHPRGEDFASDTEALLRADNAPLRARVTELEAALKEANQSAGEWKRRAFGTDNDTITVHQRLAVANENERLLGIEIAALRADNARLTRELDEAREAWNQEKEKTEVKEAAVKQALRAYLKELGAYQYWPVPMGYGAATVDCFFCYRGQFYAVECKRPGVGKATGAQSEVLRQVAEAGGGVCLENDPALPTLRALVYRYWLDQV